MSQLLKIISRRNGSLQCEYYSNRLSHRYGIGLGTRWYCSLQADITRRRLNGIMGGCDLQDQMARNTLQKTNITPDGLSQRYGIWAHASPQLTIKKYTCNFDHSNSTKLRLSILQIAPRLKHDHGQGTRQPPTRSSAPRCHCHCHSCKDRSRSSQEPVGNAWPAAALA
jgi:hypothetical protein